MKPTAMSDTTNLHPMLGMARRIRNIHMVGIGGVGMCGIAEVLLNLGYRVSGSDLRQTEITHRLGRLGAHIIQGHKAESVDGADVVVISSAVPATNPEVMQARSKRIPVIRRAEMLAELMRLKFGVAISGAHGKTTTTSLIAQVLGYAGLDPTVVVGGKLNAVGTTAQLGKSPLMVVEADESDGSFLHLSPTVAVVTNIDVEHLDHYKGGIEEIRSTFKNFLSRLPFYGLAVMCGDHPQIREILPKLDRRVVTYGFGEDVEIRAIDIEFDGPRTSFEVISSQGSLGRHSLSMLGQHNVENALAALAVAYELGVSVDVAREGLLGFKGVDRRFSVRGEINDIIVVDDYGHHPAEIVATLKGTRCAYPNRRIVALFQPHRYSRTKHLLSDFAESFHLAQKVFVLPVYAAGEEPLPGADYLDVVGAISASGHNDVSPVGNMEEAIEVVCSSVTPGDLVIAFGAGDIGQFGGLLVQALT